jgi:hypothetical protein
MDLQTELPLEVTPSLNEDAGQTAQQASLPPGNPAAPAPVVPEKTLHEKIREKGTVAPSAEKPPVVPAAPAFTPSFKFKAANKEHEIPEFLRGVIKDEQSQKFLHQLFEKAYGIDTVKERFQGLRQEHQQLNQAHGQVMSTVQMGREAYQRGDLDTVFKTFRIDENKVLQWAVRKVQLSQMPPDQRQVHEARELAERRNWELERTQASQSQEQLQAQSEQIMQMLDLVLERPDYSSLAQEYDARTKAPGVPPTFRDLAVQMGEFEFSRTGKVLSPMEAAERAAALLGSAAKPPQQAAPAQIAQQATPATPPKIVLPNVGTGKPATTPAKSPPKSLDDLRKIHAKMTGQ